jgi:hypothetical protein
VVAIAWCCHELIAIFERMETSLAKIKRYLYYQRYLSITHGSCEEAGNWKQEIFQKKELPDELVKRGDRLLVSQIDPDAEPPKADERQPVGNDQKNAVHRWNNGTRDDHAEVAEGQDPAGEIEHGTLP